MPHQISAADLAALRSELGGPLFERGDDGYQAEIDGFNSLSPMAPDLVVGATSEADVQAAVRFAAAHGLEVVVQATGHGSYRGVDGGLLIRTHRLDSIVVDPSAPTVTIGAGARWMDILPALGEHGLAAVTGSSPSVGAVGLVLGGGVGPLSRTLGWAADRAVAFRVVIGDGSVVVASAESEPELFWALKGGKVGLGVVTELTLDVLALPEIYGGGLFFEQEHIDEVHRAWLDWAKTLPESANTSIAILRLPPEGVPEPLLGRTVAHVRFAYVEEGADAERLGTRGAELLAPMRAVAPVYLDGVGVMPTVECGTIHAEPFGPLPIWERGEFLDEIDADYVERILEQAGGSAESPFATVETRLLGGAIARDTVLPNAIGGRGAAYSLLVIAAVVPGLNDEALPVAGPALFDAVAQYSHDEINYNWAGHPSPAVFARLWPAETAAKLAEVRRRYDPAGTFGFGN
ncbi:FAD-binding oxidoreductase [Herbiconiux moechotypicola]|uniref:FAD-binding oxidoreductase n=1 Tax=Herbiconiux moechotypicola TaxID=637393 RepID=A0ABN3DXG1_9MICO|nr:FAD-binding oxidoreductase [Herbiconiux moechotypicola]MCS5730820.1 FAD-binding oxidoreductase [Herbiconiux moechotypicola]